MRLTKILLQIIFTLFLVVAANFLQAQSTQHVLVKGTKCKIVPPKGFVAATNFAGFVDSATQASIMVTELPTSFFEMEQNFTVKKLDAAGMVLNKKLGLTFNGYRATELDVSQYAYGTNYKKYILIFGDSSKTIMVNGISTYVDIELGKAIKESILGLEYDTTIALSIIDAANFTIGIENSNFKPIIYMAGSVTLALDSNLSIQKPSIIIAPNLNKTIVKDIKIFAFDKLRRTTNIGKFKLEKSMLLTKNLHSTYHIAGIETLKDKSKRRVIQRVLVTDKNNYFILVAYIPLKQLAYYKEMLTILDSFKPVE
jgi:hypothetical protein